MINEWIKIEEQLPPNNIYVIIAYFDARPNVRMYFIEIASRMNNQWVDDHNAEVLNIKHGKITHWMPLPDAPEIL